MKTKTIPNIEIIKVGDYFLIEGDYYKLMKSNFKGNYKTHETRIKRFYFRRINFEDIKEFKLK